jgi:hypothetical protein
MTVALKSFGVKHETRLHMFMYYIEIYTRANDSSVNGRVKKHPKCTTT